MYRSNIGKLFSFFNPLAAENSLVFASKFGHAKYINKHSIDATFLPRYYSNSEVKGSELQENHEEIFYCH